MKSSRREDCQDQQHHTFPGTGDKVLAHTSSTKLINLERSGKQKPICYFYLLLRASPLRCPQTLPTLKRYQVAGLNHHKHYTLKHWDNSTPLCQSRSSPTWNNPNFLILHTLSARPLIIQPRELCICSYTHSCVHPHQKNQIRPQKEFNFQQFMLNDSHWH